MFKHNFSYSIWENFIPINIKLKNKIKKIKVKKFTENTNNFNKDCRMNPTLKDIVDENLTSTFKEFNLTLDNCWVQHYKKNDYHSLHTHFNKMKDFSFVWFISGSPNSSPIRFFDVGYPVISTGKILTFKFKPGLFLLFPGFLPHEVPSNKSNNRVIVSGNLI